MSGVVEDYIKALDHAKEIADRYEAHYNEPISAVVQALGATIFIEANKRAKNGPKPSFPQADNVPHTCAKCNGPIWDNRGDKAAGKVSSKYPDWKCKDQDCGWVAWVDAKPKRKKAEPEPELPEPGPDDGLPW